MMLFSITALIINAAYLRNVASSQIISDSSCINVRGFESYMVDKEININCELVQKWSKQEKKSYCDKQTNYRSKTLPLKEFCPESCGGDCSSENSPKKIPSYFPNQSHPKSSKIIIVRTDDVNFEVFLPNSDRIVTCATIHTWNKKKRQIYCSKQVIYEDKNIHIFRSCPEACDYASTRFSDEDPTVDGCRDVQSYRFNGIDRWSCRRNVVRNPQEYCGFYDKNKGKKVSHFCPELCQICKTEKCKDDSRYMYEGDGKTCDFVSKNPKFCNKFDKKKQGFVAYYCPLKCNICTACTDNSKYKFNGNKKGTCKWVSRLPYDRCSLVDKARSVVAKNCPESCGLCASVSIFA